MAGKRVFSGQSSRGWHRIEKILRCPFLAKPLEIEDELPTVLVSDARPRYDPSPALVKGSLMHEALAAYFKRQQVRQEGGNVAEWMTPFEVIGAAAREEAALEEAVENDPQMWYDYTALIQDCFQHWELTFADTGLAYWRVLGVEEELRASIKLNATGISISRDTNEGNTPTVDGGYLYTQRADLIVEIGGKVYFVDHKTTSRPIPKYDDYQALNGQFLGYELFGKLYAKEKWGGSLLHYLSFPDKKEFSYAFRPAPNASAVQGNFAQTIVYAEELYATCKRVGYWPHVYTQFQCMTRFGQCPKFSLCRHGVIGLKW